MISVFKSKVFLVTILVSLFSMLGFAQENVCDLGIYGPKDDLFDIYGYGGDGEAAEAYCNELGGNYSAGGFPAVPPTCTCPTLDFNQSTVVFAVLGGLALGFMALRKRF